jgi:urease accessory protein
VVQKALYPEGGEVCHAIVVHPPAGIAGGDELEIDVRLQAHAHALLTTPGAAKWYRSSGPPARQRIVLGAAAGAVLEWLPQESIVFDGALAELQTRSIQGARYCGWEMSAWDAPTGRRRAASAISATGAARWHRAQQERGCIDGGGGDGTRAGLQGQRCSDLCASAPHLAASTWRCAARRARTAWRRRSDAPGRAAIVTSALRRKPRAAISLNLAPAAPAPGRGRPSRAHWHLSTRTHGDRHRTHRRCSSTRIARARSACQREPVFGSGRPAVQMRCSSSLAGRAPGGMKGRRTIRSFGRGADPLAPQPASERGWIR